MDEIRRHTREVWHRLNRGRATIPTHWQSFDGFLGDMGEAPSTAHDIQRLDLKEPWNSVNAKWIDPAKGKGEHIINRRYGRLVAVDSTKIGKFCLVICRCDCGQYTRLVYSNLLRGRTRSCGCLVSETVSQRRLKHGKTSSRTFKVWFRIRQKCRNENYPTYGGFGGRGIGICERWEEFSNFLLDMGEKPEDLYLSRRDKDGDFSPGNCFWSEYPDSRAISDDFRRGGLDAMAMEQQDVRGAGRAQL